MTVTVHHRANPGTLTHLTDKLRARMQRRVGFGTRRVTVDIPTQRFPPSLVGRLLMRHLSCNDSTTALLALRVFNLLPVSEVPPSPPLGRPLRGIMAE